MIYYVTAYYGVEFNDGKFDYVKFELTLADFVNIKNILAKTMNDIKVYYEEKGVDVKSIEYVTEDVYNKNKKE